MKGKIFGFLAVCYVVFALALASSAPARPYHQGWIPPEQVDTIAVDEVATLKKLEPNCMVLWAAKWCPSCTKMKPIVKQLRGGGYTVHVFDYDEYRKEARKLNIRTLPTTIIHKDGKEVARHVKVVSKAKILKTLKKNNTAYELY